MLLTRPPREIEKKISDQEDAPKGESVNIFLLGATPQISFDPHEDPISRLGKTGGNTGNQIIAHALLGQIDYKEISWDHKIQPQEVKERFDMFVIAAANFLFYSFDFSGMAEYIEKADLPVAIVGLGAQSNNYNPAIQLQPGTERFLRVISERAVSIGVRGPFTQEVLNRRGIHNVTVTGCPSYYMHGGPTLNLAKPDFDAVRKISVNASRDVIKHAFDSEKMSQIVREIYHEAIVWGADFIAQSEHAEIKLADSASGDGTESALNEISSFLTGIAEEARVRRWAVEHVRVFFNVDDWIKAIHTYDFVFGNRFHGNILAVQQGVPACVVCHDTRTEEMCKFLGLPHVSIVDLPSIDIKKLYELVDCSTLNERYKTLFPQYVEFLQRNNLRPKKI
jgi:hypothetical protein